MILFNAQREEVKHGKSFHISVFGDAVVTWNDFFIVSRRGSAAHPPPAAEVLGELRGDLETELPTPGGPGAIDIFGSGAKILRLVLPAGIALGAPS